ncbi:MAG TPA: 6-carboxytetrahydropterin synthase [Gemmatimonadales bacterium]|nr:6-carboxytetrahydropterin synthase [Gemmatimonadales bacterium]
MPTTLTRTVSFFARHRMYRPEWTPERNRAEFGPLSDEPGHGHDYQCAVTVRGAPDAPPDLLVDLAALDGILREEVFEPCEGKYLNRDLPAFADTLPTCEALAEYFYQRISARLPAGVRLERVRVSEDPTLHADCTGLP